MTRDDRGFLWLATGDGLNRFDGAEIKQFRSGSGRGGTVLQGSVVRAPLVADSRGGLWFNADGMLQRFDTRTERFHTTGLEGFWPFTAGDSTVWVIGPGMNLYHFRWNGTRLDTLVSRPFSGEAPSIFYPQAVLEAGGVYWFSSSAGIFRIDLNSGSWSPFLQGRHIRRLAGRSGRIAAADGADLLEIDPLTGRTRRIAVFPDRIETLKWDGAGIWAGLGNGDLMHVKVQPDAVPALILSGDATGTRHPLMSIETDGDDLVFAGFDVNGLIRINLAPPAFSKLSGHPGLFTAALHRENEQHLWVSDLSGTLLDANLLSGEIRPVKIERVSGGRHEIKRVSLLRQTGDGFLWIGSAGQLLVRRSNQTAFDTVKLDRSVQLRDGHLRFHDVGETRGGWLVAANTGLYRIARSQEGFTGHLDPAFLGNSVLAARSGAEEREIIGTERTSVSAIRRGAGLETLTPFGVNAIAYDRYRRHFWLASNRGLLAYRPGFEPLPVPGFRQRAGDKVYAVLVHDSTSVWCSTNAGLVKLAFANAGENAFLSPRMAVFDETSGLPSGEFITGAYSTDARGRFYFGSIRGPVWFHPDSIIASKRRPVPVLLDVLVNEEPPSRDHVAELLEPLQLEHTARQLYFRFGSLELAQENVGIFAYRLVGWDPDWIQPRQSRSVRYTNVTPGQYFFQVRMTDATGAWTGDIVSQSIYIRPAFYQTLLFRILVVLAVALVIGGFVWLITEIRYRKKLAVLERRKALDEERMRISREMHDDIGSGLTRIALMSETLKIIPPEKADREVNAIADASRNLIRSMQDIVWSLNPDNARLDLFIPFWKEQLYALTEVAGFTADLRVADPPSSVPADGEILRGVLLLSKELIHNAIKHSRASRVVLELDGGPSGIFIRYSDDGTGFDPAVRKRGHGIDQLIRRVERLGGTFALFSEPGKGTRVEAAFPLSRQSGPNTTKITPGR